jgi:NitT/TauT family transport system substrate-binding protein
MPAINMKDKSVMRRFCGVLSLIAVFVLALAGVAEAQTPIKFTLDWRFEGQTSFMWLGLARGYFKQEGLDVQVDPGTGSTAAIQRIHTGPYDMGLGDISSLIEYAGNFPDQQRVQMVYLQYDEAPLAFFALKKSGITSIAGLSGKSVIGGVYDVNRRLFPIFAKAAKIDPASVNFINIDPALRANAVIQGSAIATGGFSYAVLDFEARGVKPEDLVVLNVSDLGVHIYGNGVLVSTKMIKENPKAVTGFVRAFNRSLREALADPEAAIKALKVREPLVDEKIELSRLTLMAPSMATKRSRMDGLGGIDTSALGQQIKDVASVFALKSTPTVDMVFNSSFLPPKSERMPLK